MATIRDIAQEAGVGVSTVSYVLNRTGLQKVSEKTRKRIIAVAQELNYVPNIAGKALRQGKTYNVAVLCPNISGSFLSRIIAGIEDELNKSQYSMLFCKYRSSEELIEKCRLLMGKQIDGVIIHGDLNSKTAGEIERLNSKHPVVVLAHPQTTQDIPAVYVDGEKVNRLMIQHLMENGHSRIAVQCHCSENRKKGAENAVSGTDTKLYFVPVTVHKGKDLLDWILAHPEKPTAVSAYSDVVAFELISAAYDRGIRIPEDLSVIGCDGDDFGALIRPALTSVKQPDTEQGGEAVRLLLKKIGNKAFQNSGIENIFIPKNVELIGDFAFANCNKSFGGFFY